MVMEEGATREIAAAEVTPEELASRLGTENEPVVLDVRDPDEFDAWAIAGAVNVPLGELSDRIASDATLRELTRRDTAVRDVVVVCASGRRSGLATEALRAAGVPARSLAGGMSSWSQVQDTASCDLDALRVVQVRRRGKGCLSYVAGAGGEALVADPSLEVQRYLSVAAGQGWRITRVFDTHLHADHVSGARALAEAAGARLCLSEAEPFAFAYDPVEDGMHFSLGAGAVDVEVIATPGHTPGSVMLHLGGVALVSGDTLFVGGVGRPDLADRPEEDARSLYRSLRAVRARANGTALVLPAHFDGSAAVVPNEVLAAPLDAIFASLPPLSWDEPSFVAWTAARAKARPPRYLEILRINAGEVSIDCEEARLLELGPNRCAA